VTLINLGQSINSVPTLLKKYGILKIIFHTGKSMEFETLLAKVWKKYGIFEKHTASIVSTSL
jgi:hypothetical protein